MTAVQRLTGQAPKFPLVERLYLLNAVRYVSSVIPADAAIRTDELPDGITGVHPGVWADREPFAGRGTRKILS